MSARAAEAELLAGTGCRRCPECEGLKAPEAFGRDSRRASGRKSHCRQCCRERDREYRERRIRGDHSSVPLYTSLNAHPRSDEDVRDDYDLRRAHGIRLCKRAERCEAVRQIGEPQRLRATSTEEVCELCRRKKEAA